MTSRSSSQIQFAGRRPLLKRTSKLYDFAVANAATSGSSLDVICVDVSGNVGRGSASVHGALVCVFDSPSLADGDASASIAADDARETLPCVADADDATCSRRARLSCASAFAFDMGRRVRRNVCEDGMLDLSDTKSNFGASFWCKIPPLSRKWRRTDLRGLSPLAGEDEDGFRDDGGMAEDGPRACRTAEAATNVRTACLVVMPRCP